MAHECEITDSISKVCELTFRLLFILPTCDIYLLYFPLRPQVFEGFVSTTLKTLPPSYDINRPLVIAKYVFYLQIARDLFFIDFWKNSLGNQIETSNASKS